MKYLSLLSRQRCKMGWGLALTRGVLYMYLTLALYGMYVAWLLYTWLEGKWLHSSWCVKMKKLHFLAVRYWSSSHWQARLKQTLRSLRSSCWIWWTTLRWEEWFSDMWGRVWKEDLMTSYRFPNNVMSMAIVMSFNTLCRYSMLSSFWSVCT